MKRQRGGLVPIGDALSSMGGPVKAIREASPQARHHFTQVDQVNQLVSASEADPDLGFMARMMALCSLPRTNPGNRKEYKRVNGPQIELASCARSSDAGSSQSEKWPGSSAPTEQLTTEAISPHQCPPVARRRWSPARTGLATSPL